jgi:excisionase family DNA binding protein
MEMISVKRAAELMGMSESSIRGLERKGLLRNVERTAGGHRLIPREEIDHLLNMRRMDTELEALRRPESDGVTLDKALDEFLNNNKE